jgi:hypothetical protein
MKKILIIAVMLLSGCSYATYTDGNITATGYSLWNDKALDGLQYQRSKDTTQVQIKGLESNQTKGIEDFGKAFGAAIGEAAKVYTGKP